MKFISRDILYNAFENISKRMELIIEVEGNHFESLLYAILHEIKLECITTLQKKQLNFLC